jgi:spore germination protein D
MSAKSIRLIPVLIACLLLTSCGSGSGGQSQTQSYKDTKSMVLDVLKTEDGQKAIQEASEKNKDKTAKLLSSGEGVQIQAAVKDVLTDPSNSKLIEKTMTDPKFAGDFAKAIQKSNKDLHKDLMKDPEYQKSMLDLMNTTDFQKMLLSVMKSPQYRQQVMTVMEESMKSPLFRAQMMELFKKVAQDEMKPKEEDMKAKGAEEKDKEKGKEEGKDKEKDKGKGQEKDKSSEEKKEE